MHPSLNGLSAAEVIRLLELKPHPEGGHYRETFRDPAGPEGPEGRSFSTAIYYLLDTGETSEWHRVDAAEIWHHYAGAPLVITVSANGHDASAHHLGHRSRSRAAAAIRRAGRLVAERDLARRLDAGRLHRRAGLRLRGLRDGPARLAADAAQGGRRGVMAQEAGDIGLVLECERRIVNAWPSPATLLIGDWVVRFASGYSGRANSATPLKPGRRARRRRC